MLCTPSRSPIRSPVDLSPGAAALQECVLQAKGCGAAACCAIGISIGWCSNLAGPRTPDPSENKGKTAHADIKQS